MKIKMLYFLREEPWKTYSNTQNLRQLTVAGEKTCINKWTFYNLSIRGLAQKKPRKGKAHMHCSAPIFLGGNQYLQEVSLDQQDGSYTSKVSNPGCSISKAIFQSGGRTQISALLKVHPDDSTVHPGLRTILQVGVFRPVISGILIIFFKDTLL